MAIEVPKESKVYTTRYTDFKGVDFTNDATNVWYRRSPSALNMLPDDAGKPYKRHGWVEVISDDDFINLYESLTEHTVSEVFNIRRCYYFELAGLDHIVIFTNIGVFCYRRYDEETEGLELWFADGYYDSDDDWVADTDCLDSYDRTYFFEGNGMSAFYIYGNYRVWRYSYVDEFKFEEMEQRDLYIPLIRFSVSPDGNTAELLESVNLLGSLVKERFQNNISLTSEKLPTSADFTFAVDNNKFATSITTPGISTFTYVTDHWELGSSIVDLANYGIEVIGNPADDDQIKVTTAWETVLGLEMDATKYAQCSVCVRDANGDYSVPITVVDSAPSTGECRFITSGHVTTVVYGDGYPQTVSGEDEIEIIYPRDKTVVSAVMSFTDTQEMSIGGS